MAAVDVTISGVLYDKINRTTQPVVLIGEASLTGVGIGGGPIIPPPKPSDPGAHPEHPIFYPPGSLPHPEHPIVIPPDAPEKPPDGVPPVDWKVIWSPETGWIVVGVPNVPHPAPST